MATPALSVSGKISLWDKFEIVIGDGSTAGRYLTRLEDFGQGVLVISVPEFVSGSDLLTNGAECRVVFTKEDAVYRFDSVIAVIDRKGRRTYLLRAPERIQRVQRRQFVRITACYPLTVTPLGSVNEPLAEQAQLERYPTESINISGGGMLIHAPVDLQLGDLLLVDISFFAEMNLPTPVAAVVRRVDRHADGVIAGIEFIRSEQIARFFGPKLPALLPETIGGFDQLMQNKLVNYVFGEQVKLRQKGLL